MTVRELLADETKWTQGAAARTRSGATVGPDDHVAAKWCLRGALMHCGRIEKTWPRVATFIRRTNLSLGEWNDLPGRTFAEVRALILELDL